MYKFIYDVDQVKKFYSLLSPLNNDEAYFVSLSARNKYLSAEERQEIDLGRTEMFGRKLIKYSDFETFIRVLRTYEVNDGGYTSRSNIPLPMKCLVLYVNINPVSGMKALKEFYEKSTQLLFDLATDREAGKRLASLDTELMNCYQRAKGTKKFIDIDFDIPEIDLVKDVCSDLKTHNVIYHIIKTKSGFHVLVQRDTLKYNYTEVVKKANDEAIKRYGHAEVIVNINEMVPTPGTIQAGHQVSIIEV